MLILKIFIILVVIIILYLVIIIFLPVLKTKSQLIDELTELRKQINDKSNTGDSQYVSNKNSFMSMLKNQVYNVFKLKANAKSGNFHIQSFFSTANKTKTEGLCYFLAV